MMQSRVTLFDYPGGDTIQLLKTKQELEKIGVEVDISLDLEPNLSKYDIVHLFNLTRVQETYQHIINAKRQGKPVVLSTIYWPFDEMEKYGQLGLRKIVSKILTLDHIESLKATYRYFVQGERNKATKHLMLHSYNKMQKFILQNTDYFLPNSQIEMEKIAEHLNFKTNNYTVIPNSIDLDIVKKCLNETTSKYDKYDGYIICVGRIDTRKNQLRLLEAIEGTDYKLLLIGKHSSVHKKYFRKVMEKVKRNPNIEYIESVPNEEIYSIYKHCKVSVLPSWFETPGLVSLEAAAMGCNIVVSDRGTTRDYFKEYAYYCDPSDIQSIREAIEAAYTRPYNNKLRDIIFTQYTWTNTAKKTLEAYKKVLERGII